MKQNLGNERLRAIAIDLAEAALLARGCPLDDPVELRTCEIDRRKAELMGSNVDRPIGQPPYPIEALAVIEAFFRRELGKRRTRTDASSRAEKLLGLSKKLPLRVIAMLWRALREANPAATDDEIERAI